MADELAEFWVHEVKVKTYEGSGPFGDSYSDPVEVECFVDHTRQLVRSVDSREVTSEVTVRGPVQKGHLFKPESVVTVDGVDRRVITQAVRSGGTLDLPDHFEVTTT